MDPNELWAETAELADLIIQSADVVAFQAAEMKMNAHPEVARLMVQLKETHEQIGDFQARHVPPKHYLHLLEQSESILHHLESIPEVIQFQNAQSSVNNLLQEISLRLAKAVFTQVNSEKDKCRDS